MNLADLLWTRAERAGHGPAIEARGSVTSWVGFRRRSAAWAAALTQAGLTPGDRVAILCPGGPEAIAAYFGVLAAGGIAVQLDLALREAQMRHILHNSGARLMAADPTCLPSAPDGLGAKLTIVDSTTLPGVGEWTPVSRNPDDPAQLIYTSGSTGLAKGVVVSHGNLLASARIVSEYLGIGAADRIAALLPVSFVYGLSQVLLAVNTGATLVFIEATLPADVVDALRRERISVLAAVPLLWHQWLATPGFRDRPLPLLRVLTNAGGGVSAETALAITRAQPGARLFLMYGLTEALRSTFLPPEELPRRPGSIGRPIAETEIFLLREDGMECGTDEVGEIVQAGPTVTLGYWDNPEATAHAFVPHPRGGPDRAVRTGDLARRDAEGFLYFVGRRDRQVKSLGYRVNPEELEHALTDSGLTAAHAVLTVPDPLRGHMLVAYVVLAPEGEVAAIRRYCGRGLPRHLQPTAIRVLTELPRLPSGKPDLARLAGL